MRYEFIVGRSCRVKTFLKEHDISKGLLAKIKFEGGHIWVNGEEQFATYPVHEGDVVAIEIPDEAPHETLKPIPFDLDIVYEDDNFLVINKPYGCASIPSVNHDNTMANFVKHHFVSNNYPNQRVHIVTRLDKDTSGLMLFAKHGYAHARMDKQLQQKSIKKHYYALVEGDTKLEKQGEIIAPIARDVDSIITRRVHKSGKYAHTSYRLVDDHGRVKLVDINLAYWAYAPDSRPLCPLRPSPFGRRSLWWFSRLWVLSARPLHCHRLAFVDPFTKKEMVHASSLTDDFETVIMNLQTKKD